MPALRIALGIVLALLSLPARAQEKATAIRCNAAAIYETAVVGSTRLVGAPVTGGIYVCGFMFGSAASATISARLSYSTSGIIVTSTVGAGPVVTGAAQVPITPAFSVTSPTIVVNDTSSAYRGLYIPPGNQLNITTSVATGTMQALVYYFQQQQ
jgi:hypothetical protein